MKIKSCANMACATLNGSKLLLSQKCIRTLHTKEFHMVPPEFTVSYRSPSDEIPIKCALSAYGSHHLQCYFSSISFPFNVVWGLKLQIRIRNFGLEMRNEDGGMIISRLFQFQNKHFVSTWRAFRSIVWSVLCFLSTCNKISGNGSLCEMDWHVA